MARAASEVLSRSLARALDGPVLDSTSLNRAAGPAVSNDRTKALLAGANHLVSGYLENVHGKLRLHAVDEDLVNHDAPRNLSAEAAQPLPLLNDLARAFSPSAAPYLTSNQESLKLYATAIDETVDRSAADLREATRLDPNFGPAWVSLAEVTALSGGRSATIEVATDALNRKLDPLDSAAIRVLKAAYESDKPARLAATRDLSAANPADLALLKSLAESDSAAGQFAQAAGDWKKLRDALPNDRDAWNQLGYAIAWSGDFPGALASMKSFSARWPDDANAIDSTGDVDYMYGKFADAAALYLKANEKGPRLLSGGDLYKAAWAQFRAGDLKKADATFEQFRSARTKLNFPNLPLFQADWLYRTGREKEAIALIRKEAEAAPPQTASGLWSQLVIWDLIAKDRAAAAKDAAVEATKPASNISTVARFAALPSASAAEWEARANGMLRGPGVENARRYTLALALILDGRKDAARPLWDQVAQDSPATDFFVRAIAARLHGEKPKTELVPDSLNVNQLSALPDKL